MEFWYGGWWWGRGQALAREEAKHVRLISINLAWEQLCATM